MLAGFDYVRRFNLSALLDSDDDDRSTVILYDRNSGAEGAAVQVVRTPPGSGSPAGRHTHVFEQIYVLLHGTMGVEVADVTTELHPGDMAVFPAGVPHRNWVHGDEATVHVAINSPAPELGKPIAQSISQ